MDDQKEKEHFRFRPMLHQPLHSHIAFSIRFARSRTLFEHLFQLFATPFLSRSASIRSNGTRVSRGAMVI